MGLETPSDIAWTEVVCFIMCMKDTRSLPGTCLCRLPELRLRICWSRARCSSPLGSGTADSWLCPSSRTPGTWRKQANDKFTYSKYLAETGEWQVHVLEVPGGNRRMTSSRTPGTWRKQANDQSGSHLSIGNVQVLHSDKYRFIQSGHVIALTTFIKWAHRQSELKYPMTDCTILSLYTYNMHRVFKSTIKYI